LNPDIGLTSCFLADFRGNRSLISREIDHRFHFNSNQRFHRKRSPFSRDTDHQIGPVKTVIGII